MPQPKSMSKLLYLHVRLYKYYISLMRMIIFELFQTYCFKGDCHLTANGSPDHNIGTHSPTGRLYF